MSVSGRGPSRISGSGRKALPDVREWLGGPPGCPGMVRMVSLMLGIDRDALPVDRECLGVFGRPSRMSRSDRESLPDVRECSDVVGSPSRMSGSCREALPDVRE